MTIRYRDGHTVQAALLARTGNCLRIAINGFDDATEFQEIHGSWVSDDCEPVTIEFAWDHLEHAPAVREEDCLCPPELATRLLQIVVDCGRSGFQAEPPERVSVTCRG